MESIVRELWRWPVKGMTGEPMPSLRLDGRGAGGDRTHAVLGLAEDGAWLPLSRREAPRLAAWDGAYPFNLGANVDPASPPYALATSPRGRTFVWDDPRLRSALEDDLGRPVQLRRDLGGLQHVERTVLVVAGDADAVALRANVALDADPGLDQPGRVLAFDGGVRLRLLRPCPAGGAYARVLSNGRVQVGSRVRAGGHLTAGASGSGGFGR
jgi:hypothetical protein